MKKILILLIYFPLIFTSCQKEEESSSSSSSSSTLCGSADVDFDGTNYTFLDIIGSETAFDKTKIVFK